jgi:hypothetical protein
MPARRLAAALALALTALIVFGACGAAPLPPPPTGPAFPAVEGRLAVGPGPAEPPAAEVRHAEAETYTLDVAAPQSAEQFELVWVKVSLKPLGDMQLATDAKEWTLAIDAPGDVMIDKRSYAATELPLAAGGLNLIFALSVNTPGTKHVTVDVAGSLCDPDFCDTVTDKLSFNLDVYGSTEPASAPAAHP